MKFLQLRRGVPVLAALVASLAFAGPASADEFIPQRVDLVLQPGESATVTKQYVVTNCPQNHTRRLETVNRPPYIGVSFDPGSIPPGGCRSVTFSETVTVAGDAPTGPVPVCFQVVGKENGTTVTPNPQDICVIIAPAEICPPDDDNGDDDNGDDDDDGEDDNGLNSLHDDDGDDDNGDDDDGDDDNGDDDECPDDDDGEDDDGEDDNGREEEEEEDD